MGRWSWSDRHTVEECKVLSIFWLAQHGYLRPGRKSGSIAWHSVLGTSSIDVESVVGLAGESDHIRLSYVQTRLFGEPEKLGYRVHLVTTPCRFGGVRYWFICPGQGCHRRVAKLYLPPGGRYFLCRHCYHLTYESRRQHRNPLYEQMTKPVKRMQRIRERLGGSSSLLEPFPPKPRGMRHEVYMALWEEYASLFEVWQAGVRTLTDQLRHQGERMENLCQSVGKKVRE